MKVDSEVEISLNKTMYPPKKPTPNLVKILCKYQFDGRLSQSSKKEMLKKQSQNLKREKLDDVSMIQFCEEEYNLFKPFIHDGNVNSSYETLIETYLYGSTLKCFDYLSDFYTFLVKLVEEKQFNMLLTLARSGYQHVKFYLCQLIRCSFIAAGDITRIKTMLDHDNQIDLFIAGKIALYEKDYKKSFLLFEKLHDSYGEKIPYDVTGACAGSILITMMEKNAPNLKVKNYVHYFSKLFDKLRYASNEGCFISSLNLSVWYEKGYCFGNVTIIKPDFNQALIFRKKALLQGDVIGLNSSLLCLPRQLCKSFIPDLKISGIDNQTSPLSGLNLLNSLDTETLKGVLTSSFTNLPNLNIPNIQEIMVLTTIFEGYFIKHPMDVKYLRQKTELDEKIEEVFDPLIDEDKSSLSL